MAEPLPAITGLELARLLQRDGWIAGRNSREGIVLSKLFEDGRTRVTVVGRKRRPLADGTLAAILGPKQTGVGRDGLRDLIHKYGLK